MESKEEYEKDEGSTRLTLRLSTTRSLERLRGEGDRLRKGERKEIRRTAQRYCGSWGMNEWCGPLDVFHTLCPLSTSTLTKCLEQTLLSHPLLYFTSLRRHRLIPTSRSFFKRWRMVTWNTFVDRCVLLSEIFCHGHDHDLCHGFDDHHHDHDHRDTGHDHRHDHENDDLLSDHEEEDEIVSFHEEIFYFLLQQQHEFLCHRVDVRLFSQELH
jgi:hypothetical protein